MERIIIELVSALLVWEEKNLFNYDLKKYSDSLFNSIMSTYYAHDDHHPI